MSLDTEINPATVAVPATRPIRLGLRQNAAQFTLLVVVNALVGGMLGQERTVLPLLAESEFGLQAYAARRFHPRVRAGQGGHELPGRHLVDRYGRKPVLVAGWLVAVPVPVMLIWAPTWAWVVVANVLLGVSQATAWSTTVIEIDLVGPARRRLAMGLNEAAGYSAVAAKAALVTGFLADTYGLRPAPFLLCVAFAALGLGLSAWRCTRRASTRGSRPPPMWLVPTAARVSARRAERPAGIQPDQFPRAGVVLGHPGGAGQQPQRRRRVGFVSRAVRIRRIVGRPCRDTGCALPGGVGDWTSW